MSKKIPTEFEVEKILDKIITENGTKYFIKWKGFPNKKNTWEPVENV